MPWLARYQPEIDWLARSVRRQSTTTSPQQRESDGPRCVECTASVIGPVSNPPSRAREGLKKITVEQLFPCENNAIEQRLPYENNAVEQRLPHVKNAVEQGLPHVKNEVEQRLPLKNATVEQGLPFADDSVAQPPAWSRPSSHA
ncbi:hypothetical protein PR001_g27384 [Phytophthora rubi]|uniref:Uncharacterized protein n=1 Tax=Phytophthora rubi TaxID=129364 RepID=A0A6A3HQ05_9STRA|nr:hypothetical protein PR001_g27384 [Phytophthora rubi]